MAFRAMATSKPPRFLLSLGPLSIRMMPLQGEIDVVVLGEYYVLARTIDK